MKKIIFNNNEFLAEKIVKIDTDIIGYNGNVEAFAFRGISDFSLFSLQNGEDFDKTQEQANREQLELMQKAIDELIFGGAL